MKRTLLISFFIFLSINLIAEAFLVSFNARSESDKIILTWQTAQEINIKEFVVERESSNSSFVEIARIKATGDNSVYTYIDENAFKTADAIYKYRLKIVEYNSNNPTYSMEVVVSHSPSPVKRTWGSIKALFR
ncbi:MAG: hypothetical protein CVV23_11540 [Ignavibacteriae bacterium HGW-Ignavibacteriae-2]|jgi:hypothetical protein|nr:hypothetical protein [Bacteroidota bacterium]PKL88204.1 MAG: hypothetical protein CVV23_11540 [Ignavibacteriae bacterium HGW-Ignavibacteriae-2]